MANNKKRRGNNGDAAMTAAERDRAERRAAQEKQRREDVQNLLLLIGVIAVLAVVGIVIFLTSSGSDDEKKAADTAAVAATGIEAEAEAAGDEAAPAEGEVTSTTVLEAGAIYTVENDMPLYAEASTGSEQLLTLLAGYQVAVLEPAEAGNGWHNVRVWLGGGTTDGYIQIP